MPGLDVLPGARAHFVPPFGVFRLAVLRLKAARVVRSVLVRSSNRYPLGNCDSLKLETFLELLDPAWRGFYFAPGRSVPFSRY